MNKKFNKNGKIRSINLYIFFLLNYFKKHFNCPVCGYNGPFKDAHQYTGVRKHALCPMCNALERHRIQFLAIRSILKNMKPLEMRMLHVAPEPFFKDIFSNQFGIYETADLNMKGVDHIIDLQRLPFDNKSYDIVFASHVLEHILDDIKAISEIRRILKPGGIAILPVPIIADETKEYGKANPFEANHVRAPGPDYFDRYKRYFSKVEIIRSDSLPSIHQLYIYEDRSHWPTEQCPLRPSMKGKKHLDIVPVCYV
jgi:SAM-dependent methyltransferase